MFLCEPRLADMSCMGRWLNDNNEVVSTGEAMTQTSLEILIRGLNEAGVRYMVVGGLAVIAHGYVPVYQ